MSCSYMCNIDCLDGDFTVSQGKEQSLRTNGKIFLSKCFPTYAHHLLGKTLSFLSLIKL
ncbi:nephrocystin-3 isoform X2 [Iris pallida]|uniref:Nephrocystin-3 isoform X2 n=1 Tax=Iris pallida TaxID=29817 RepID=A0AAX6FRW3_IRIPA|nr:nephrocystin-3 isoform X2 [Iris pallida]